MALVSGIGGGISGAWAETPDSVALPLSYKGSDAFPNLITVGVGGGAQGNVTFDVGSTGFYVLESVVGPDVTNTGIPFEYGYEDGTEFTGYVGETIVSFKTATGTVETETVRVGVIENFTCSGGGTSCMDDRVGVMGVRYYQYKLSEGETGVPTGLFNPLAFLPDNLASGYMVAATGPTPSIIVGLTANNIQGMPSTTLTSMNVNTPIEQFAPLAWELKSIEACFQVEGNAEQCDVTSFDTGESDAQFTAPPLPTGDLPAGTRITITIESVGITRTFVAGDTNWVDKFNVLASPEGEPPGFNSGAQFYNSYAIAYDYFSGRAYFSPITTWITGDVPTHKRRGLGTVRRNRTCRRARSAERFFVDAANLHRQRFDDHLAWHHDARRYAVRQCRAHLDRTGPVDLGGKKSQHGARPRHRRRHGLPGRLDARTLHAVRWYARRHRRGRGTQPPCPADWSLPDVPSVRCGWTVTSR